jgi:hypothetical protein
MVESLMRSERRAEANSKFQTFLNAAQVWTILAQRGMATAPNVDEFVRDWLESWEEDGADVDRYFSNRQMQAGAPVPGMTPDGQAPEQLGPAGITAQQSIDPATSPSAQASLSGETHAARMGAMTGGISNT